MGTLFFAICFKISANESPLKVAIFDTGFCPNKIVTPKNVSIGQVLDATQSVNYKCNQQLASRQFHGHWVLAEVINGLEEYKSTRPLHFIPIVIFDRYGKQSLNYWEKAIAIATENKVDLIIAAAGLPINKETGDETKKGSQLILRASNIKAPSIPMLVAAGRMGKEINETTLLFPQDFFSKDQMILFGSYHQGLDPMASHFADTSLLRPKNIDYFLPFNYKPRLFAELKGTSLSVAKGSHFILKSCTHPESPKDCLAKELKVLSIKAKTKNETLTLKTLDLSHLAKK